MNSVTRDGIGGGRDGFTLVELIVASTLLTIVLGGVYTTFSTSVRAWRSGESNYETYEDARRAFGILTRELRAIPPEALHLMNGSERSIEFVTLSEPMNVEEGRLKRLMWVSYRVVSDWRGKGTTLEREEAAVEGPLPAFVPEQRGNQRQIELGRSYQFTLARSVEGISFFYQWALPEPHPPHLPPRQALLVGDSLVEAAVPEGIEISLTLHDPGAVSGSYRSTFTEFVTFRGRTSVVPRYLRPVPGD